MSDFDNETIEWLNGLKLGDKLSYVSDFENGYYMGVIFERLNLAKGRKFKNSHDMACKFQNFKNVRDLLYQNFKVEFPIQNILFNTQQLLMTIRDCFNKYNRQKKEATLRKIETFSASKMQPSEEKMFASRQRDILSTSKLNQTGKFPKKIQEIQQKLQKYRDIKTKHQIFALQDRKRQIQQNRRLIQQHRQFQLTKVRTNHQFTKQHERKVYDVWNKTEQIKKQRIEKQTNLNTFLQQKQNKFYQSLRNEQIKSFNDGLDAFQLNCIRQGIQLQHDPDRPKTKPEEGFNKQVVMERIKDNIKINEKQKKERIKRQNKKNVDAKEANIKAQLIWNQNTLVQSYAKKINSQISVCKQIQKRFNQQKAEKTIIIEKAKNRSYSELPPPIIDQQKLKQQYRLRKMQYREQQIIRLQRRQVKHKAIAQNILEGLLHIVISNQDLFYQNNNFSFAEWSNIEQQFLSFERKDKRLKDQSQYLDQSYNKNILQYLTNKGQWQKQQKQTENQKPKVAQLINELIQRSYPPVQSPTKSDVPLYMPLKIAFVGDKFSGKTTISQKISSKYGVLIINPVNIIGQAFQLNKEPVVEDPKKKKDSKKPEDQNPQKLALKQWGQKLMKKLDSPSNATIQHYLEAIQFKLRYNYQNKSKSEIVKQFQQSKIQQTERFNKAVKEFEQIQKKGKKDSKKGGAETVEQQPTQRKYFYTKGFILDGINLTLQEIKKIELKLNGYLSFDEKINWDGQKAKQQISAIVPLPKTVKDKRLQSGTFDLIFHLDAKKQILESRGTQKVQIKTQDFQKLKQYYDAFGIQKYNAHAFCSQTNQLSIEECLAEVSKKIEAYLDLKYEEIQGYAQSQKSHQNEQPKSQKSEKQLDQNQPKKQQQKQKQKQKQQQKQKQEQEQIEIDHFSNIKAEQCKKLIQKFNQFFTKYKGKIGHSFSDFDKLRREFGKNILQIQQTFMSIINRPDDKAGKILNFQQNYNRLLTQKTNIVKDAEASRHLISKLDELNDGLWLSLQSKKNEAVAERQKVLVSHVLNNQIQKIIQISKNLLENQLNLLVEIIFFIYSANNALKGHYQQIPTQYLVLGIPPNIEPIFSFEINDFASDRLDYYTNQAQICIKGLPQWLAKKQKKYKIQKSQFIEQMLKDFIDKQVAKINVRIKQIRKKTKQIYLQYYCFFKTLTNKMDDWIIQGIKYENQFIYEIYKNIKKNILQAKKSAIKDLFVKDITQILHPISSLPMNRLPIIVQTSNLNLKILSYAIFLQEIRCLASGGRISFKVLEAYLQKRKKSSLLDAQFLKVELDILQQYLVTDQYCNFKEVALAMLLWKFTILDEDSINQYQNQLTNSQQSNGQANYQYFKEELSFQQFKNMPCFRKYGEEDRVLKIFIFQIFRQEFKDKVIVKDYIDTLKLFSQLQVQRYGDTLMMLHQGKSKHTERH